MFKTEKGNEQQAPTASPSPEEFIRVWQTSRTLREACLKLRMKRTAARVRAFRYLEHGVPLKEHEVEPPPEPFPWEDLAKYAASLVPSSDAPADAPDAAPAPVLASCAGPRDAATEAGR